MSEVQFLPLAPLFMKNLNDAIRRVILNEDNPALDKKTLTVNQLASKWKVPVDKVLEQLSRGIKVEREHTSDDNVAAEIARDHLGERLDYYEKLAKFD